MAKTTQKSKTLSPEMADILEHLIINIGRAMWLVALHERQSKLEKLAGKKNDLMRDGDDLPRAAIVFTHASLEEFLRSCSALALPMSSGKILNAIPLAGLNNAEKFFLGKLADFRGKSVDDLIRESVYQHLQKTSYSSSSEVAAALGVCGLDVRKVRRFLPALDEMIKRRHQIVHRFDCCIENDKKKLAASKITSKQTRAWINQTGKMLVRIFGDFTTKHGTPKNLQFVT